MAGSDRNFVGRTRELDALGGRLASGARLVTLWGTAGVGKTRLARESVRRGLFGERAAFVELGEARSLEAIARAAASAIGARLRPGATARDALAVVAAALGERTLVLDHADPVIDAAAEAVEVWLARAPGARFVVTSREPLGVPDEETLVVEPLDANDGAVLFSSARARGGSKSGGDDDAIAAIVRRLDGLPLAIELAAARTTVLSVTEVASRLEASFDLLDRRRRPAPASTTLRGALDASWDLLGTEERRALAACSVFEGRFPVDAAVAVVSADDAVGALDALEALVAKSLVVRDEARDHARLSMLGVVRAYASARLAELAPGERAAAEARHAAWVLARAEALAERVYGPEADASLDALGALLDEILAAHRRARAADPETATRLAVSVGDLALARGLLELREELFDGGREAAERCAASRPALLARFLVARARLVIETGRMTDAEADLLRARELARGAGDAAVEAEAERSLGWTWSAMLRFDDAAAALARARAHHVEAGAARGEADALCAGAFLHQFAGRPEEARAAFERAMELHVRAGDGPRQRKVLSFVRLLGLDGRRVRALATIGADEVEAAATEPALAGQRWRAALEAYQSAVGAHARGDRAEARARLERARLALEGTDVGRGAAVVAAHLAAVEALDGDLVAASAHVAEAREALARAPDPGGAATVGILEGFLELARGRRDGAEAALAAHAGDAARFPEAKAAADLLASALRERPGGETAPEAAREEPAGEVATARLEVGPEATWMRVGDGPVVDLARHGAARRVLAALVERHGGSVSPLDPDALLAVGWPGERVLFQAGRLRVYTLVRRLRRLGLEGLLVTRDDGYLLDPRARVVRSP